MDYFKNVVAAPDASFTVGRLDFGGLRHGSAWLALITFLYVDFLDATGTLPLPSPLPVLPTGLLRLPSRAPLAAQGTGADPRLPSYFAARSCAAGLASQRGSLLQAGAHA